MKKKIVFFLATILSLSTTACAAPSMETIKDGAMQAIDGMGEASAPVVEQIQDGFNDVVDHVENQIQDGLNNLVDDIADSAKEKIDGVFGDDKEEYTSVPADDYITYEFRNDKLLDQHYEKHGIEMGFGSAEEYQSAASDVLNNPDVLHKPESEDDDEVYYLEVTNEFVVLSDDGYIRTYFNPSSGKSYYDRQ